MGKRSAHRTGYQQKRQARRSTSMCAPHILPGVLSYTQMSSLFRSLPESVILCDHAGNILRFNPAALTLFEVADETLYRRTRLTQFLASFQRDEDLHQPDAPELWLNDLVLKPVADSHQPEKTLRLHLPSGREIFVDLRYAPLLDEQLREVGIVALLQEVTHRSQKALHLRRAHEAVLALGDAIASLSVDDAQVLSQEPLLRSPLVAQVAQPLVDLIRQMLNGRRVLLLALGPTEQLSYIAGSGLTAEQVQILQVLQGALASTLVEEQVMARLSAHLGVLLTNRDLRKQVLAVPAFDFEYLLLLPLFLKEQFAGLLVIVKAGASGSYTPDEVEFATILVEEIELLVECLGILRGQITSKTRALVQQEICHFSANFLTLASHELKTPLTGIMGNIQLAQRRLVRLQQHIGAQEKEKPVPFAPIEEPLAFAVESARLQERVINEMIETIQQQPMPLEAHMQQENLLSLVQETLTRFQDKPSGCQIVLKLPSTTQSILIRADRQQIIQVLTNYLINALHHAAARGTVTVQVMMMDTEALISVHVDELGIVTADQQRLWQRSYERKCPTNQPLLDMNLGAGFSLCRMLIEQHHGQVGVQCHPEQGTTFWLTVPVEASPQQ